MLNLSPAEGGVVILILFGGGSLLVHVLNIISLLAGIKNEETSLKLHTNSTQTSLKLHSNFTNSTQTSNKLHTDFTQTSCKFQLSFGYLAVTGFTIVDHIIKNAPHQH
jgi:hypothetical protein